MKLAAMRFKDYVWPHNPRTYTIEYQRRLAVQELPYGSYRFQELGQRYRMMKGEGEFVGEGAYEEFKKLASVYYLPGPGTLIHPVWQTAQVYFTQLSLAQEPRADYVRYTFTFLECPFDEVEETGWVNPNAGGEAAETAGGGVGGGQYYMVGKGDTLWAIARRFGLTLEKLIELNPQIKNPNRIYAGERVRVG